MPDKKDRDLWWAFINGRPECDWNPPKKPKRDRSDRNRYKRGMRSWDDESAHEDTDIPAPASETYVVSEDGEVVLAEVVDPAKTLPTPFATPQPEHWPTMENLNVKPFGENPSMPAPSSAPIASYNPAPRKPTPSLLKLMDNVSFDFVVFKTYSLCFPAILPASFIIFQSLDRSSPKAAEPSIIATDTDPRTMDLQLTIACRRAHHE